MLENTWVVGQQILLIFLFVLIGLISVKGKILKQEGAAILSNLSLVIVTPAVIINSFQRDLDFSSLKALVLVAVFTVFIHIIAALVAKFFVQGPADEPQVRIERFATIFSNCGYMGIPLASAVIGEVAVYYLSVYIGVFNVIMWTLGLKILQPSVPINWRTIVYNPGLIGLAIGLFFHLLQFRFPYILGEAVGGLAQMNTPLSMLTTGMMLAKVDVGKVIKDVRIYLCSALKLLVIPGLVLASMVAIQAIGFFRGEYPPLMAMLLAVACPSAGAAVLFPTRFGLDGKRGAEIVAVSTVLSLITLPVISYLGEIFLVK